MKTLYIGIDPGKTGAVAVLESSGSIVTLRRFDGLSTSDVIRQVLIDLGPSELSVALELVHAMPGQGVTSMFTFGEGFGRIQGFLDAKELSYALYTPQTWQKHLPKSDTSKGRVKAFVEATHGLAPFMFPRCRVPHSGCLDAFGIADYHRRVTLGLAERKKPSGEGVKKRKTMMKF